MTTRKAESKNSARKKDFQEFLHEFESMILTSKFKPRERLVEADLSKIFGVSRYWVRDAFKVLETKGLVAMTPYKGVRVSELSAKEIEELFVIRVALEQLAWSLAMENATDKDIKALKELTVRFEQTQEVDDVAGMVEADSNFHDYVLNLSRNKNLKRLINDLRNRCHIIRYSAWSSPDVLVSVVEEHRRFVDAMETRDKPALLKLADRHISHAKRHYLFQLQAGNTL
jgi:DNA-binding GntR family transcriptional regulator